MYSEAYSLLKRIKVHTRKKLNTLFVGEYHSAFKGRGLLFNGFREYQIGDDVRSIDWNVSARMNHLYVKEYTEERELSIILVIDFSASLDFGTVRPKRDVLMEITALLLYLSQMNNDRVSVVLFTEEVEKYMPPQKGRRFILSVLHEILHFRPGRKKTSISTAVDFLDRVLKKRSVIFLISDFLDDQYLKKIMQLKRRHDCILISISDPFENKIGISGLTEFVDRETGEVLLSDSIPAGDKESFRNDIDSIRINTAEPVDKPLLEFFEKRNKTRHGGNRR